jgi:hypothetical protein
MSIEEVKEEFESLDTDDVAEKRLRMQRIFEKLVALRTDLENSVEGLKDLKDEDGYMYKLSQDFLLSSSTMEKESKLEKIVEHVERKNQA